MSNPKRQHYIPKMLLKHFVDDRGLLQFTKRDAPRNGVRGQRPDTLFFKKHLYTFTELDGTKDFSTERFFSKLESETNPIVCKIVDNARDGKLPNLTHGEREVWDWFFMTLWRRLPDVCERLMPSLLESEDLQKRYRDCMELTDVDPIDFDEMREFIWKEAWPRSLQENDELMEGQVLPTLSWMNLWVAVVPKGQAELIVGSNPVIRISGHSPHLSDPGTELILALAHDVAVCFIHDSRKILYELKHRDVRDFNSAVFDQSTMVAGRSRKQIESLVAIASNP